MSMSVEQKEKLRKRIEARIDRFADLMKVRMNVNLNKGDWRDDQPAFSALNLVSQVGDLASDLLGEGIGGDMGRLNRCINVANFAFILADNLCGHLFTDGLTEEDDKPLDADEEDE